MAATSLSDSTHIEAMHCVAWSINTVDSPGDVARVRNFIEVVAVLAERVRDLMGEEALDIVVDARGEQARVLNLGRCGGEVPAFLVNGRRGDVVRVSVSFFCASGGEIDSFALGPLIKLKLSKGLRSAMLEVLPAMKVSWHPSNCGIGVNMLSATLGLYC